jgi:hypothetical protein
MPLAKVSLGGRFCLVDHHSRIARLNGLVFQHLQDLLNNRDTSIADLEKGIATAEERLKESEQKLREAESTRRKLHNTILVGGDLISVSGTNSQPTRNRRN